MAKRVTFAARNGGSSEGEIVEPAGTDKAPTVVLVQEWWGLNDHIRSLLDRLSGAGFVAMAPDLYHGKVTRNADEAGKLMQELDGTRAMNDIAGAVAHLQAHPRGNGKVGIMGFCMGGAYSLRAATEIPELSAVVSFYGIPPAEKADYSRVRAPVQSHVAERDQWVTPERAREVQKKIQAAGAPIELHVYDADHAFVNDTRPEVYSPDNAKLAWQRAMSFLHKHLG